MHSVKLLKFTLYFPSPQVQSHSTLWLPCLVCLFFSFPNVEKAGGRNSTFVGGCKLKVKYVLNMFHGVLVLMLKCYQLSLGYVYSVLKIDRVQEKLEKRVKDAVVLFFVFFSHRLGRKNVKSPRTAGRGETDTLNRGQRHKTDWREICSELHQLSFLFSCF